MRKEKEIMDTASRNTEEKKKGREKRKTSPVAVVFSVIITILLTVVLVSAVVLTVVQQQVGESRMSDVIDEMDFYDVLRLVFKETGRETPEKYIEDAINSTLDTDGTINADDLRMLLNDEIVKDFAKVTANEVVYDLKNGTSHSYFSYEKVAGALNSLKNRMMDIFGFEYEDDDDFKRDVAEILEVAYDENNYTISGSRAENKTAFDLMEVLLSDWILVVLWSAFILLLIILILINLKKITVALWCIGVSGIISGVALILMSLVSTGAILGSFRYSELLYYIISCLKFALGTLLMAGCICAGIGAVLVLVLVIIKLVSARRKKDTGK